MTASIEPVKYTSVNQILAVRYSVSASSVINSLEDLIFRLHGCV